MAGAESGEVGVRLEAHGERRLHMWRAEGPHAEDFTDHGGGSGFTLKGQEPQGALPGCVLIGASWLQRGGWKWGASWEISPVTQMKDADAPSGLGAVSGRLALPTD